MSPSRTVLSTRHIALGIAALACAAFFLSVSSSALAGTLTQEVTVKWQNNQYKKTERANFSIPSVGTGSIVCRPNTTWIQMVPGNPGAENDMWSAKTELKNGKWSTAVKNARVYRFSTPTSTISYGSGNSAFEGFNQFTPVERESTGSMFGLISTRGALNASAGQGGAPTSFVLSWSWKNLYTPKAYCSVNATFTTQIAGSSVRTQTRSGQKTRNARPSSVVATSLALNWHGEAEAPLAAVRPRSLAIPGIGTAEAQCQTLATGGTRNLILTPLAGSAPYVVDYNYEGEGFTNITTSNYYTDALTNTLGPIPLPMNGMTHLLFYASATATKPLSEATFSSYAKINDPNPANNYCEIAGEAVTE